MNGILDRSKIHTGVDVNTDDKILTLYTCYQSLFDGGRLVVFARQLRGGETEEINASKVYYNSNARFPQAYYDAKKMTNPFAPASEPATTAPKPTPSPVPAPSNNADTTDENITERVTDTSRQGSEESPSQTAATEASVTGTPPETASPPTEANAA